MEKHILETMNSVAEMTGSELVAELNEDTVLLESGLDSLGFAILVARLEEELGYDPFTLMEQPVYPRVLGDLFKIYKQFASPEK
ncbi:MAG: acyl carrier protein [Candidatus Zixiibacteriota bacterium]|nr:MAG: acyl carrier protein [candidate division Zixibacteria bacterium]